MRWFLNRTGQYEGPFEEAALADMIRRGEVPPTSQICAEGASEWKPLLSHPPFAGASSQAGGNAPSSVGVAATMAMPGIDPGSMPGMLGSLGGPAGAPPPGSSPGVHTPPPGSSPGMYAPPPGSSPGMHTPPPVSSPGAYSAPPAHPGGYAPHASNAPAATAVSPHQEKKSKLPLILGGGCGLLLLLTICITSISIFVFSSGDDRFATRSQHISEIIKGVAVDGRHADADEWGCVSNDDGDLLSTPADTRATMAQLGGNPEVVLTAVELVAVREDHRVGALALVFPDGRVRYSNVRSREISALLREIDTEGRFTRGWSTGRERDTDMLSGVETFLELLAQDECDVEWVSSADLEGLPTDLVGDIMEGVSIPPLREACTEVADADDWSRRRIDGISVIVRGNGHTAVLSTSMRQDPGTSVCISPIRARLFDEDDDG